MPSLAGLLRVRLARAAALVAVVVFGLQGAAHGPVAPVAHVHPATGTHAVVAAQDLTPAYTILPAVPAEIAKPTAQRQRPSVAEHAAAVPAAATVAVPPIPGRDRARTAALRPAALFYPPYSARGPPLLA